MDTGKPLSQLLRLLELVKAMPCTRLDVFNRLGILNCAQRISELRKLKHPIDTTYTIQTDEHGRAPVSLCTFGAPIRKGRPIYGIKI